MISHIALVVSSVERSERFYLALLGPLGFVRADSRAGEYVRLTNGRNAVLVLTPSRSEHQHGAYHRHQIGVNHFAFLADTREIIDVTENSMRSQGILPIGDGKVDTGYRGVYYTVAFLDPDGIMVEIVHHGAGYFEKQATVLFPE